MLFCPKCVFQFDSREQFEQHNCTISIKNEKEKSEQKLGQSQNKTQIAHSNSELSCSICKISFANHQILSEHLTSHQIGLVTEPQSQSNFTNQNKIFLCSKCNQQFSSKESCLGHEKICIPNIPCQKCNKLFISRRNLEMHTCKTFKPEIAINSKTLEQSLRPKSKILRGGQDKTEILMDLLK